METVQQRPYVPQHSCEDVATRRARPAYSNLAQFNARIDIYMIVYANRDACVTVGRHRADEVGE